MKRGDDLFPDYQQLAKKASVGFEDDNGRQFRAGVWNGHTHWAIYVPEGEKLNESGKRGHYARSVRPTDPIVLTQAHVLGFYKPLELPQPETGFRLKEVYSILQRLLKNPVRFPKI